MYHKTYSYSLSNYSHVCGSPDYITHSIVSTPRAKTQTENRPSDDPDEFAGVRSTIEIFVGAGVGAVRLVILVLLVGTLLSTMVGNREELGACVMLGSMEGCVVVVGAPLWTIVGAKEAVGTALVEGEIEGAVVDGLEVKLGPTEVVGTSLFAMDGAKDTVGIADGPIVVVGPELTVGPKVLVGEALPIVVGAKEEEGRRVMVGITEGMLEIVGPGLALGEEVVGTLLSLTVGANEELGPRDIDGKAEPYDVGALVEVLKNGMFPMEKGAAVPACVETGAVVTLPGAVGN